MPERKAMRCYVSGRVQGVCYRMETRQRALELGLSGWVRNLADGRVEVLACGGERELRRLRDWLKRGPALARVHGLDCSPAEYEEHPSFRIA